ncbi:DUF3221 domain-containing protein [Radiobacillus sp. PE A8.2]|uniref:DUF3221 domain-containing protein n=1 Tax=Radiobacillus sp. PE A8.2 TaxID=3380349 RepID=UPI00388CEE55
MSGLTQIKILLVLILSTLLGGCSEDFSESKTPDIKGCIYKVDEKKMLVIQDISKEIFDEIKDLPMDQIKEDNRLIQLSYNDSQSFHKGDLVEVWLEGDEIMTTNPALAPAKKIKLKE